MRKKRDSRPRNYRHKFTREECQRGYQAALMQAVKHSWKRYAWLYYRIRGWYRAKRRVNGRES